MNIVEQFCLEYDFPKASVDYLSNAYDILSENEKCFGEFSECVKAYEENFDFDAEPVFLKIEKMGALLGIKPYTLDLLYLISLTPQLKKLYEERNIKKDIYDQSVLDLKWKNNECFDVYGYYGIFVGWWTIGFFKLKRFGLGKLQFNKRYFSRDIDCKGITVKEGDLYLDVHIPSNGRLDHDKCIESYNMAYEFFKNDFGGKPVVFACHSWLLSSNNKRMLPEKSNIHKFMSDYTVVIDEKDERNTNLWRIFGTFDMPENLDDLPQDTSLQKAVVNWLKQGNTIDQGLGIMIMQ